MEKLVTRNRKVALMDVSTTSIAYFLRITKFTEISKSKNPTEYSRTYVDEDGDHVDWYVWLWADMIVQVMNRA